MKRILFVLLAMTLVLGCDQAKKKESRFAGVEEEHDYVAEGMKYLSEANVARAIQSFDAAIKQEPANPENYITLGQVYLRLNQFPRAIDTFSAATKVAPNNGDAYYFLAFSQALDGRREDAINAAQKSVEIFMQERNEPKFKQSLSMLRGLMEAESPGEGQGKIPEPPEQVTTE